MTLDIKESLCYDDVLITPAFSDVRSRSECDISVRLGGKVLLRLPVISAPMDTISGTKMCKKMHELGGMGMLHRYMSLDETADAVAELDGTNTCFTVGTLANDKERIDLLLALGVNNICIDVAYGDTQLTKETIHYIRKSFKGLLIAGNVCTYNGSRALLAWGADVVRTGIGGGSVCSTRLKTGVGAGQLSAVWNTSHDIFGSPTLRTIADGGIRTAGDAAKALAAGTQCVMVGGMLAGTDCTPYWNEQKALYGSFISYRGMASKEAREKFTGKESNNAEGVSTEVRALPAGSTESVITDIVEGIRSSMSYVGARSLYSFQEKATFVRVSPSTVIENGPHKIKMG